MDSSGHLMLSKSDEDKDDESRQKSSTVVFSCHQTDVKFVYFLHKLILTYAPSVVVKSEFFQWPREDGQSGGCRSHRGIPLPKLHRISTARWRVPHRALAPAGEPRPRPSPPTRGGCGRYHGNPPTSRWWGVPSNTWDVLWANLQGVKNVAPLQEIAKIGLNIQIQKLPTLLPEEMLPMTEVAQLLMAHIKAKRLVRRWKWFNTSM